MTATKYQFIDGYIIPYKGDPLVPLDSGPLVRTDEILDSRGFIDLIRRANTQPALVEALDSTLALIRKAQERLCAHLVPEGSNDDHEALNDLLYMLDGPEQREIERKARAAIHATAPWSSQYQLRPPSVRETVAAAKEPTR